MKLIIKDSSQNNKKFPFEKTISSKKF